MNDLYRLLEERIAEAVKAHQADLNRCLFADGAHVPLPPLTWRQKVARKYRRFASRIWWAWTDLFGREHPDDTHEDYWDDD